MFANIQMLRAYAAILVVCYHMAEQYPLAGGRFQIFTDFAAWGYAGVDVFFVISGFIMAHTSLGKPRTFGNARIFLKHRLIRIYLGYWPFFIVSLLLMREMHPGQLAKTNFLASFFLTSNNLNELLLPVTWSLTYELYYYLLVFASFIFAEKVVRYLVQFALFIAIFRVFFFSIDTVYTKFFFADFLVEFLAGYVLYLHHKRLNRRWMFPVTALACVALFRVGVMQHATNNEIRVFTFGFSALCLVATFVTLEQCRLFKANWLLVSVGDASYTLYLSHLAFAALFYSLGVRTFLAHQFRLVSEFGFFAYIAFIIAFSVFVYQKFELPIYRKAISA